MSEAPQLSNSAPKAKKSLGQNFLQDANIARKIVRLLDAQPDDRVFEIGPGPGALTRHILAAVPTCLVLVEKDSFWAQERLEAGRAVYGEHCPLLSSVAALATLNPAPVFAVVEGDALAQEWEQVAGPWKVVGNLPYNVASPLMWELFSRAKGLERAVFMVQKEVGMRLAAQPGNGIYGALSVWVQSFVRPHVEFIVPPQVFHPRPKVDSAVLSFKPVAPGMFLFPPAALAKVVKGCFQWRRKQMGSIMRMQGEAASLLELCGIAPAARPEELPITAFHALARVGAFTRKC